MRLKTKLPLAAIVPGLIILLTFIATQWILKLQEFDSAVVNLAGRQRMLSQKMTKEAFLGFEKVRNGESADKELNLFRRSVEVFDNSLTALRDGGEAPISLDPAVTEKQQCSKPSKEVADVLASVEAEWKPLKEAADKIVSSGFTDSEALKVLAESNGKVLAISDKATSAMQKASEGRVSIIFTVQIIGLILGVLCIIWVMGVVSILLKKLSNVNSLMFKYAKGDLTERIEVSKEGDELDETLTGVNHLGENITSIISEIHTVIRTLQTVSGQFFTSFDSIAGNAQSVKGRSATVAAASEESTASVASISAAAEQMSTSMSTVASAMEEMSSSIREVSRNCQNESKIVSDAIKRLDGMKAAMQRLDEATGEIGRIVTVINDIAGRTRLLSLNATIEAVSAGEAGKGFAVVANEVKELARQTTSETEAIRSQIENMKNQVEAAQGAMIEVVTVIEEVNVIAQTIAATVEEQSATSNEIARNIGEASTAATEVARNVSQTATGLEEVSSNIQRVNTETGSVADSITGLRKDSNKLTTLNEDLGKVIDSFKINGGLIEWSSKLSTSVPSMDKQHMRLIDLINNLNNALAEGRSREVIGTILTELADYTVTHFKAEEAMLEKSGYPDLEHHKPLHVAFVKKVTDFKQSFDSGKGMVSRDLMIFLKDWLVDHIQGVDKKYGKYCKGM
ncbi:MAG: bacteriohemerythrin [Fibrobacteres bacterium]|nr:bacteriohemerythrin [Fibrobacterota bacterium]